MHEEGLQRLDIMSNCEDSYTDMEALAETVDIWKVVAIISRISKWGTTSAADVYDGELV